MKLKVACLCALWMPAVLWAAPAGQLSLPEFRALQRGATDTVNISLDPWLLRGMAAFMDEDDPDSAATKKLLSGIKSIQIRNFAFAGDYTYPAADIDALREQLRAPGWTQIVQVHNRADHTDVDIYMMIDNDQTNGFALIASEARQLTIINIVGSIKMEDLPKLQSHFHLPALGLPAAKL